MSNPFVLPTSEYKRDYNLVKGYVSQNAHYLSKMTGTDPKQAAEFIAKTIDPKSPTGIKDRECIVLNNLDEGNRVRDDMGWLKFLGEVSKNDYVLSPSMTAYLPPSVKKSLLADYIQIGIKARAKAKSEMYHYENIGDAFMAGLKNSEQNSRKILVNSLSGAQSSKGNPTYFKSSHPSLTSMCRSGTGYGNATNEKFIGGNRHYHSLEIILANIAVICTMTDLVKMKAVMDKYNLHYPTDTEALSTIKYSSDNYIRSKMLDEQVYMYLEKLDPIELAAVVYQGDLYHLLKYNSGFVNKIFDEIVSFSPVETLEEADQYLDELDSDTRYYVNYMCDSELKGIDQHAIREKTPEVWKLLGGATKCVKEWLAKYSDVIEGLWRTNHMAPSVAHIRSMSRQVVLTSDTDSTIFTEDHFVESYLEYNQDPIKARRVGFTITYLSTQLIVHVLAQLSANMGVDESDIHRLSMKNEYFFPSYGLTMLAKHYYAFNGAREGLVYDQYKMEIKGVGLRPSNISKMVVDAAHELMGKVLKAAELGEKVSIFDIYREIYEWETKIFEDLSKGGTEYLSRCQIKETYKLPDQSSPKFHWHLWQDVFSPKYGEIAVLPYDGLSVPVDLNNKTQFRQWMESIEDVALRGRLETFLQKYPKDKMGQIIIPTRQSDGGIHKEILPVVDQRRVVYNTMGPYYLILETLGLFRVSADIHRLVSDFYHQVS